MILCYHLILIVRKRVKIVHHDLKAELNPLVCSEIGQVDYILHLAAGSHVDRSIDYPMEFIMDNVVGTANILEFARRQDNLERFVYFSTDEVFGPAPNGIKYKENDRYNSTNPYSATKAGAEELAVAYENTYKLPIYITHTMNVFGERQHPEKYIPMCIKRARDGEVITIHSDARLGQFLVQDIIYMLKMFHQQYISCYNTKEHLNPLGEMQNALSLIL